MSFVFKLFGKFTVHPRPYQNYVFFKGVLLEHGDVRIILYVDPSLKTEPLHFRAYCYSTPTCKTKAITVTSKANGSFSTDKFESTTAYNLVVNATFYIHLLATSNGWATYINGVYQATHKPFVSVDKAVYAQIGGTVSILEFSY